MSDFYGVSDLSHLDNSKFRIYIYLTTAFQDLGVSHMYWKKSESTQG